MANTTELSKDEIHLLAAMMAGSIRLKGESRRHNGLRKLRSDGTTIILLLDGYDMMVEQKEIRKDVIKTLSEKGLIYMKLPMIDRYKYIGEWCVYKETLTEHAQSNEVIAQSVLGLFT